MKNLLVVVVVNILTVVTILTGCSRMMTEPVSPEAETISKRLEDLRAFRKYDAAFALIDSAEQAGVLNSSLAGGERGSLYAAAMNLGLARPLLVNAVFDEQVKKDYYPCYLRYADALIYCDIRSYRLSSALELAQQVCAETRYSENLSELLISEQMYAYIGSCQARLYNFHEAKQIGENVYSSSLNYVERDPKAALSAFMSIVTILEAYIDVDRFEETDLWSIRSLEMLDKLEIYPKGSAEYDEWFGYLECIRSIALHRLGREDEAAEAFRLFSNSQFGKGTGGVNGIYYLAATHQWHKVEELIPAVDSLLGNLGTDLVPKLLEDRYGYQYYAYRYLGKNDKALAVADSMFKNIDAAIVYERTNKAADLAAMYQAREKEAQLKEKESQLAKIWTGFIAGALMILLFCLVGFLLIRRRSELRLKEEHEKLLDAYDQLMIANERARESAKMKAAFIQQISHEIRTPLNILSGFTQILTSSTGNKLDDKTKAEANRTIIYNTTRITKLVNKMLELSDISSKAVIECTDKIPVKLIADQAIADSGINQVPLVLFDFEASEEACDQVIVTNQRSAVRALVLLLDNSRKFLKAPNLRQEGTVTLRVSVNRAESEVEFAVEDTGIGVPKEEAEHIFDEFVQLNNYYDGTGIGLSVARNLIHRIGGEIKLDTSYQPGARFVMTLPI